MFEFGTGWRLAALVRHWSAQLLENSSSTWRRPLDGQPLRRPRPSMHPCDKAGHVRGAVLNFYGAETHALLPYDRYMLRSQPYFSRAFWSIRKMYRPGPGPRSAAPGTVWGEPGTNGQHAFYQLTLLREQDSYPADFIAQSIQQQGPERWPAPSSPPLQLPAQTGAYEGQDKATVVAELKQAGKSEADIASIGPHKEFTGNRPTNSIMVDRVTPHQRRCARHVRDEDFTRAHLGQPTYDQWAWSSASGWQRPLARDGRRQPRGRHECLTQLTRPHQPSKAREIENYEFTVFQN